MTSPPRCSRLPSGTAYTQLLADLDALVGTDPAFLLGSWLVMARSVGQAHLDAPGEGGERGSGGVDDDCTSERRSATGVIPTEIVGCAAFYEWNARVQLSTWNPTPRGGPVDMRGPVDYASKHWNG